MDAVTSLPPLTPDRQTACLRADPMMERRTFLGCLGLSVLAAPLAAEGQQAKAQRVGLFGLGSTESSSLFDALRQGLRERGWVEGQNVIFEDRTTVDNYSRLPDVSAELVRLKVDLIVTWGATPALAAKKATGTIPIATATGSDPVEAGLAASLARPGGNVTGLTTSGPELIGKRIGLLKEALPRLSRIAVLRNPESRTQRLSMRDAEAAAKSLRLQVRPAEVRGPEDLEKAVASIAHERPEALALLPIPSNMFRAHRVRIVELAAQHRLPAIFSDRGYVEAGGLMSYGPDAKAIFRQLATYVDRILKGAKPGDFPIEQPTKFELVINLKSAKALGLTIPPSLLGRADEVVQ
jgi:putative ABC transport system substrate-binding protein